MKSFTKFLGTAILGLAFTVASYAQTGVAADGTATATIVTPLTILQTTQMSFGNIAVNSTAGTVILSTASGRTPSGGVTLPSVTGSVAAGVFHVTGTPSSAITIAVSPASVDITDASSNTMAVGAWTLSPGATGNLSGAGALDIQVGATLTVAGSQPAGVYTTLAGDEFQVTVNYN